MGLLSNIAFGPITGPLNGLMWLARTIQDQADLKLYDEDGIRVSLMELEQQFENGEVDEEAFEDQERILLERLKICRNRMRTMSEKT